MQVTGRKKKKKLLGNVALDASFQSSLQNDPSHVSVSDSVGSRGKQGCLDSHQQGAEVSLVMASQMVPDFAMFWSFL